MAAENSFRAAMVTGAGDPVMRYHTTFLLRPLGRLRQARAEQIETYRLAPANGFTVHELALTDSLLGLDADAVRLGGLSEEIAGIGGPPHTDVFLLRARASARAGRYAEAAAHAAMALPESLRIAGGALDAAYELAMWSAGQRAATPGIIEWSDIWMPEMRPFRKDARLQAFATRLKLLDYWRVFGPPDECDFKNGLVTCR